MFRKNSIIAILISGLFLFITAPVSNAAEGIVVGVSDGPVSSGSNIDALLGTPETIGTPDIVITGVLVEPNVSTFASFDANISDTFTPDSGSYVLNSSGILLQTTGVELDNIYTEAITTLVDVNDVFFFFTPGVLASVESLSALSFDFTAGVGHNTVSLDFILASGEYYEGDWDLAGIFINGENYAFLPNGEVLRVNTEAQIANVCSSGFAGGCMQSEYTINGGILGTLSPKLTVYAPIIVNSANIFSASVANTDDNYLPSYLLLSNFQSFIASDITFSSFTLEDEVFNFGIQFDEGIVVIPPPPSAGGGIELNQSSEITGISVSTADANNNVTIIVTGKFIEKVLTIDVNDRRVSTDAWKQTSTSITLTVPAVASGIYAVQIWNGSFPVLQRQAVVVTTK
jgi:hypothetical protein